MGESALQKFVAEAQNLSGEFESQAVFSIGGWHISQYTCYMFLALLVVFLVVFAVYQFITADLQSFIYFQF